MEGSVKLSGAKKNISAAFWTGVVIVAFLDSQRLALAHFWRVWNAPDNYYSHGPLVPILAVLMVRMNWNRLKQAQSAPSWLGLPFALIALVLQVFGAATGFEQLAGMAFLSAVLAVVLTLYGVSVTRILIWPILFLVTMIPLPQIVLDGLTGRLQILSSSMAASVLRLMDGSVVAHGNIIVGDRLPGELLVAPACSGLRLSIAIVMCVWFLVYMLEGNWKQKIAFAALAFPLAGLVNTGRITLIGWSAMRTGSVSAFHDAGGYASLAACSFLLLGAAWLIGMRQFRQILPLLKEWVGGRSKGHLAKAALLLLLLLTAVASVSIANVYDDLPRGSIDRRQIPRSLDGWRAAEMEIDGITKSMLRKADLISLVYSNPTKPKSRIYVLVNNAVDTGMFHDPRLCLPGSGSKVTDQKIVRLKNGAPAWLLRLTGPDGDALMLSIYQTPDGFMPTKDTVNAWTTKTRMADLKRVCSNPAILKNDLRTEVTRRRITWYRFVIYSHNRDHEATFLRRFAENFILKSQDMP